MYACFKALFACLFVVVGCDGRHVDPLQIGILAPESALLFEYNFCSRNPIHFRHLNVRENGSVALVAAVFRHRLEVHLNCLLAVHCLVAFDLKSALNHLRQSQ